MNGIKANGLWPKYHTIFSMQIETHICRILHSYINTMGNNFWRLLQARNILIPVYAFLNLFLFQHYFSPPRGTFVCCFFFWFVTSLSVHFFSTSIFILSPFVEHFFPPSNLIVLTPSLLFCWPSVASLHFPNILSPRVRTTAPHNPLSSTLHSRHSYSPLHRHLLYYCLTPTHRNSCCHISSLLPKREPLRHAVILRDTYVPRSSHRHLAFHPQRHSAILLLSLAVKTSLSSLRVPHVLSVLLFLLCLAQILPFSALICPDVSAWMNSSSCSLLSATELLTSFKQVTEASFSFSFSFLFLPFNGKCSASSEMCGTWTFFTEDYENPQIESTKELFCSFIPQHLVLTLSWDRLLGNPLVTQQRLLESPHQWSA